MPDGGEPGDPSEAEGVGEAASTADASDAGDGDSQDDGWETSTELPGVPGSDVARGEGDEAENSAGAEQQGEIAGAGEERRDGAGGEEDEQLAGTGEQAGGGGNEESDDGTGGGGEDETQGGAGGDDLARALEDLDGEILAERIKAERAARTVAGQAGGQPTSDDSGAAAQGDGATQSGGGAMPGRRTIASAAPPTPRPPLPTPPDTPDAKDDCVVARQIREAAMAETDPELRDALWKEYERYKSCQ